MLRIFIALGLSAGWGFGLQQALGASPSYNPIAVGTASKADPLVWRPPAEIAAKVLSDKEATGSIGKERSLAPKPATIDAAAFEELRAEVLELRRAVGADPAPGLANRPLDYAPSLAGIVKTIQGVEKRLAVLERRRVSRSAAPNASALRP